MESPKSESLDKVHVVDQSPQISEKAEDSDDEEPPPLSPRTPPSPKRVMDATFKNTCIEALHKCIEVDEDRPKDVSKKNDSLEIKLSNEYAPSKRHSTPPPPERRDDVRRDDDEDERRSDISSASVRTTAPPKQSMNEFNRRIEQDEKMELLSRLHTMMEEKGYKPHRLLTLDDPLEDIRYEHFRATRELGKKRNVRMMQKGLVTIATGVEMFTSYYNPLQLRLNGFSKSVLLSIHDYDDIFEELHFKYSDCVSIPVEARFAMMLGSSLWVYHMNNHGNTPPPDTPQPTMSGPQPTMSGPGPFPRDHILNAMTPNILASLLSQANTH